MQSLDTTTIEQNVIAATMDYPDVLSDVMGVISMADFCNATHRIIWKAIIELDTNRKPFDPLSLTEYLKETGRDQFIVMVGAIANNATATRDGAIKWARRIREVSVIRLLVNAGNQISELAENHQGRKLDELLGEAENILALVTNGNMADDVPVVDGVTLFRDVCADFERAVHNPGITGISTGIKSLDELTDGLQKGSMVIVAGPPSMGKTAFAVNLVHNAMNSAKLPLVIFSMEMPSIDIGRRMVATESRTHYSKIKRGIAKDEEMTKIYTAARRLQNPLLKVCDASMLTPAKMRAILKRIAREHGGIGMVMADYVQLMEANKANPMNRSAELATVSREMKRMAMDFKAPFIVLSQLTKDVEKAQRKPNNGDLRETGQLAQDADLIMFVHRQEKYDKEPVQANIGKAEIIVSKNRNGGCGVVDVGYDGPTFEFYELDSREYY
jgi:replicative DNA helicase